MAPTTRRNCETSGFLASAAPTGDFGLDVHIDTGVFGLSSGGLLSTVQDLLVAPTWMALVWIVHALIVMLEWCFTLDLLEGELGLAQGLASAQRYLTSPWLPLVLAIASALLVYEGLVRRRVAESLGQALVVFAMTAGGLWLMMNPAGTVGALSGWANQAGLGTLAVAAQGTPVSPARALGVGMDGVFEATIEGPWCYLEFGDVRWCRDPAMLDHGLKEAGLNIAREELAPVPCEAASGCGGPSPAPAVARSARLLTEARTNGALFLALPSNGPQRNSINDLRSLLRELCRTAEATSCTGPTAAQAEFRTNSGTWARVGGLLLISVGALGMVLLLGHIGLRLLMAAMLSLFYLLLAPGIVLAPAVGERGRALFRAWLTRLFGAVLSKLLFAFLLGVVLAVMGVLESLDGLGWWTQWLLMSAFWWGVFLKRHELLGGAAGFLPGVERHRRAPFGRRAAEMVERPLRIRNALRSRTGDGGTTRPMGGRAAARPRPPARTAEPDIQALALLEHERRGTEQHGGGAGNALPDKRAQLARITRARGEALSRGERRRVLRLDLRGERVAKEIAQTESVAEPGRQRASKHYGRPRPDSPKGLDEFARFLDGQARLPPRGASDSRGLRRDYTALAGLAGLTAGGYLDLDPGARRAARLEIDRELAVRREGRPVSLDRPAEALTVAGHSGSRPRAGGEQTPRAGHPVNARPARRGDEPESEVMRDIREVEAGRKRQLGIGRP